MSDYVCLYYVKIYYRIIIYIYVYIVCTICMYIEKTIYVVLKLITSMRKACEWPYSDEEFQVTR